MSADDAETFALQVHVNVWTVAAIAGAVLAIKATGHNSTEFYIAVAVILAVVASFGAYVALETHHVGWTFWMLGICLISAAMGTMHPKSAVLDLIVAASLLAASVLLRWDTIEGSVLWNVGHFVEKALATSVFTIWSGVVAHVLLIFVLLPLTYLIAGDERVIRYWEVFFQQHFLLVSSITVVIVWLYYGLFRAVETRRFFGEYRGV